MRRSGAIESGNKLVLQRRLKQAGMHWSSDGAQYIAALRTKYKSPGSRSLTEAMSGCSQSETPL